MRVTYRKYNFVEPKQLNKIEFEHFKSTNNAISSLNNKFNFLQDLKFELILLAAALLFLFITDLTNNSISKILFVISMLFVVVNAMPTIISYLELIIYN